MPAAQQSIIDRVVHWEGSVLGCLLAFCTLGSAKKLDDTIASRVTADQFTTSDNQAIFRAMSELRTEGTIPDEPSLMEKLDARLMAQAHDFSEGVVPENLDRFVRNMREAWNELRFSRQIEELGSVTHREDQLALLEQMRQTLVSWGHPADWRGLFHTPEDFENAPSLRFSIEGFLPEAGVAMIGGLSGHGKTLLMLAMAKALLEQSALFGYEMFSVPRPSHRVLYLIPESSIGPFRSRLQLFRLEKYLRDRLFVRTLSSREQISLNDARLLKAVEGADVFLDTAVRFMDGSENDVESARPFANTLFRLINAGARSITGAHHSPKGFESQEYMTLENILRGSGDLGAMLSTCWGVRQIDAKRTRLYLENVKPRDFQPCESFIVEGRPHLDETGQFKMVARPGEAGELRSHLRQKGGRPASPDKAEKMAQCVALRQSGLSMRDLAKKLNVSKSTVERLLLEAESSQKRPNAGQFRDNAEPEGETPKKRCTPSSGDFEVSRISGY